MDMTRVKKLLWSYSFNIGAALLSCSLILQQLAANKFSFSANIYFFVYHGGLIGGIKVEKRFFNSL